MTDTTGSVPSVRQGQVTRMDWDGTPVSTRPFWMPDTQGFLAIAIVLILFIVIMVLLLKDYANLNEKVYGALLTLLGVVAACFKDVYSFFFGSSKGSEKKDETQQRVVEKLTSTAPPGVPGPVAPLPAPVVVTAWWSVLTPEEQTAITTAGTADARIQKFIDAAKIGQASVDDLEYLVSKNLITAERAAMVKAV